MHILFGHQNFPGQYRYLAKHFCASPDWECFAIGECENVTKQVSLMPNSIKLLAYDKPPGLEGNYPPSSREFADQINRSLMMSKVLRRQKNNGLNPQIILVHPSWGEGLHLKENSHNAKLVYYIEFFFQSDGPLVEFDPEFPLRFGEKTGYRVKNAQNYISMDMADVGVAPTRWQWDAFPTEFQHKIQVIHEGVDTDLVSRMQGVGLKFSKSHLPEKVFSKEDEIITFAVRNLEPSRGFHLYMRTLPRLQKLRPSAYFFIIGGDEKSYVRGHASGKSWREAMLEEVGDQLDMKQILFLGRVPYDVLLRVFSITSLQVYMTLPFVLSWSMWEAMACEAPVSGWSTGPVTEVIKDGENGFLFEYFSEDDLVAKVSDLMEKPDLRRDVGKRARQYIIDNYDLNTICLPQHLALISSLV